VLTPEAVEDSEAVPLLRFATAEKGAPLRAVSELSLGIQRDGASGPSRTPPRASTKTKTWLGMVGLVQPLCRSVEPCEIEQKGPRTKPGANAACPRLSKNASTVIPATGPRVMNPAFHFVSGRVFSRRAWGRSSSRVISRHFD